MSTRARELDAAVQAAEQDAAKKLEALDEARAQKKAATSKEGGREHR